MKIRWEVLHFSETSLFSNFLKYSRFFGIFMPFSQLFERDFVIFATFTGANFCAPHVFLSLRTTQHDFWSATQRGADYAKGLETCRSRYQWYICIWTGSGTGSVQIPKQFGFGTGNFGKCEWYLRQSAPKAAPDVCPSVCSSVCRVLFFFK